MSDLRSPNFEFVAGERALELLFSVEARSIVLGERGVGSAGLSSGSGSGSSACVDRAFFSRAPWWFWSVQ